MQALITAAIEILQNISEMLNRETSADEKIKDTAVKSSRNHKKAILYARMIFDGCKHFEGIDMAVKEVLDDKQYKKYLRLREKFNKYS